MREIIFYHDDFFANYFWSLNNGSKIREDILVKTYLQNYFTFTDFVKLYKIVGKDKLLLYAKELGVDKRIENLINYLEIS